jgi:hypothetical protein
LHTVSSLSTKLLLSESVGNPTTLRGVGNRKIQVSVSTHAKSLSHSSNDKTCIPSVSPPTRQILVRQQSTGSHIAFCLNFLRLDSHCGVDCKTSARWHRRIAGGAESIPFRARLPIITASWRTLKPGDRTMPRPDRVFALSGVFEPVLSGMCPVRSSPPPPYVDTLSFACVNF